MDLTKAELAWTKFTIGDNHERSSIESHPAHLFIAAYNLGYNAALVDHGHAENPNESVTESFDDWYQRNNKPRARPALKTRQPGRPRLHPHPAEPKVEDS